MKNKITLEQFNRFYDLATAYNEAHDASGEYEYITAYEYDGEDGLPYVALNAYDWDNSTDFGTLHNLLNAVGVQVDNELPSDTGTAEQGRKVCRAYFLDLPLIEAEEESGDELEIEFVGINSTKGHKLWVKLSCSGVTREVCYERHSGSYSWCGGEDEPPMSKSLLSLFHGPEGESALKQVARTEGRTSIKA